jgi:adenine-specific DNA-methyltransferase
MLNKNQLYVNHSEIEDSQFKVSKEDKELNKKFYGGK